ncbi:MAG: glycosyltransferase family 2 protein [Comamonadaceae bacterium]|nr:MAG: glycosyltransferase family 2 protein [Comamonadaceae bacterium]
MANQLEAEPILPQSGLDSGSASAEAPAPAPVHPNDYAEWVRRYDTLDDAQRAHLREQALALPGRPLISVLMPTYNASVEWLDAAIESVRGQIYPNWQLCIADDASTDEAARERLKAWAERDPRIKVMFRPVNGHISNASNSALELVDGEWVALMDHDDLLSEAALFWVAEALVRHPQARLIYSDEDKLGANDQRCDPYFKPDWNIDLFYSQNFFSHLGVYQTALLREVGGFRVGFEGSQDYDLALRCVERLRSDQVHHIPRVLYHWRVHPQSTASSTDAKPYAQLAGERALNEHWVRKGIQGKIEYIGHGYRARYDLPSKRPLVSLIIPTRNAVPLVRQCINSILARTSYEDYEIILVDNGSDDPEALAYFQTLAQQPGFQVIRDDREFNYSALNNLAVASAHGEIVGLINNDIEVISADWLSEMVSLVNQPGVGAVGAKLWYPNKTLQHGGVVLGVGGVASHAHKGWHEGHTGYFGRAALIQSFSAVTAACLLITKKNYEAVGGLNERDLKVAFNDVDLCLRLLERGLRNVWTPYAELFHHESATRGDDLAPERRERFASEVQYMLDRWGPLLQNDPAYNRNLTLHADNFELAWPPRAERQAAP